MEQLRDIRARANAPGNDKETLNARAAYETNEGARGGSAVRRENCQEDEISGGVLMTAVCCSSAGNSIKSNVNEAMKASGWKSLWLSEVL